VGIQAGKEEREGARAPSLGSAVRPGKGNFTRFITADRARIEIIRREWANRASFCADFRPRKRRFLRGGPMHSGDFLIPVRGIRGLNSRARARALKVRWECRKI